MLKYLNLCIQRTVGHTTDVLSFQYVDVPVHAPGLAPGVLHVPLGPLLDRGVLPARTEITGCCSNKSNPTQQPEEHG